LCILIGCLCVCRWHHTEGVCVNFVYIDWLFVCLQVTSHRRGMRELCVYWLVVCVFAGDITQKGYAWTLCILIGCLYVCRWHHTEGVCMNFYVYWLVVCMFAGDITQKGYEKKRQRLLQPYTQQQHHTQGMTGGYEVIMDRSATVNHDHLKQFIVNFNPID